MKWWRRAYQDASRWKKLGKALMVTLDELDE